VSRARAQNVAGRRGFPLPILDHPRLRLWLRPEVEAWLEQHRPGWRDSANGGAPPSGPPRSGARPDRGAPPPGPRSSHPAPSKDQRRGRRTRSATVQHDSPAALAAPPAAPDVEPEPGAAD